MINQAGCFKCSFVWKSPGIPQHLLSTATQQNTEGWPNTHGAKHEHLEGAEPWGPATCWSSRDTAEAGRSPGSGPYPKTEQKL